MWQQIECSVGVIKLNAIRRILSPQRLKLVLHATHVAERVKEYSWRKYYPKKTSGIKRARTLSPKQQKHQFWNKITTRERELSVSLFAHFIGTLKFTFCYFVFLHIWPFSIQNSWCWRNKEQILLSFFLFSGTLSSFVKCRFRFCFHCLFFLFASVVEELFDPWDDCSKCRFRFLFILFSLRFLHFEFYSTILFWPMNDSETLFGLSLILILSRSQSIYRSFKLLFQTP